MIQGLYIDFFYLLGFIYTKLGKISVKHALQAIFFFVYPAASNLNKPLLLETNFEKIINLSPGIIFLKKVFLQENYVKNNF